MKFKSFLPAIIWFIISVLLLTLPQNNLPNNSFFAKIPYFDKWVHTGMFFLLTALFSLPFTSNLTVPLKVVSWFNKIAVYVVVYGIIMEFVQKFMANGRSFDVIDIVFDTIGSILGSVAARVYYRKKIGPDGNQGRNQN